MIATITAAPDGSHIDVFVPITFKRLGGRKTIMAADGTTCRAARPPTRP